MQKSADEWRAAREAVVARENADAPELAVEGKQLLWRRGDVQIQGMAIYNVDLAALRLPPQLQSGYVQGSGNLARASASSYNGSHLVFFNVETEDDKLGPAVARIAAKHEVSIRLAGPKGERYYEVLKQAQGAEEDRIARSLRLAAKAAVEVSGIQPLKGAP